MIKSILKFKKQGFIFLGIIAMLSMGYLTLLAITEPIGVINTITEDKGILTINYDLTDEGGTLLNTEEYYPQMRLYDGSNHIIDSARINTGVSQEVKLTVPVESNTQYKLMISGPYDLLGTGEPYNPAPYELTSFDYLTNKEVPKAGIHLLTDANPSMVGYSTLEVHYTLSDKDTALINEGTVKPKIQLWNQDETQLIDAVDATIGNNQVQLFEGLDGNKTYVVKITGQYDINSDGVVDNDTPYTLAQTEFTTTNQKTEPTGYIHTIDDALPTVVSGNSINVYYDLKDPDNTLINEGTIRPKLQLWNEDVSQLIDVVDATVGVDLNNLFGTLEANTTYTVRLTGEFDIDSDGTVDNLAPYILDEKKFTTEGNFITSKTISKESMTEDNTLEFGEEITYTLGIENITDTNIDDVEVSDGLLGQGLDQFFDIDQTQTLVLNPTDATVTPVTPTIANLIAGITVDVPANSKVEISFTLTAKSEDEFPFGVDANINNIATITDPTDPGTPYNPNKPILPPTVEKNPQETVKKTVINPTDGIVAAGDSVQYKIEVGPLTEKAHLINVKDTFSDPYLSFQSIDSVQLNGVNYTGSQIDNSNILTGVSLTLLGNFNVGDTITVTVTGKVSDDLPINEETGELEAVSLTNVATANVDGTVSKPGSGIVITDPNGQLPNGNLITSKSIISEDGTVDGTLEPEETIKYAISLQNVTEATIADVEVKDNLVEQGFDKYFDINPTEALILNPTDATTNPTGPTLQNLMDGMKVTVPGNSTVTIIFDLTALSESDLPYSEPDEGINNIATIVDPNNPGGPYNPVIPILPPVVLERDPEEILTKSVVKDEPVDLTPNNVAPGDIVKYSIKIEQLQETAHSLEIKDAVSNKYLTYTQLISVQVDGKEVPFKELSTTYLDILIDTPIEAGSSVEVIFSAKVSQTAPDGISIDNEAFGVVDGTETLHDAETVVVGDGDVPTDTGLYTEKTILNEDGDVTEILEPSETVTYQIKVANIGGEQQTVKVKDDFIAQGLDQIYTWNDTDNLGVNTTGTVTYTPDPATIASLQTGIDVTLDAKSSIEFTFDLKVKDETDLPSIIDVDGDGETDPKILNIATITGGTGEILVPGVDIFLPELKPSTPLTIEKIVDYDNMDGSHPWETLQEYVYTITVTNTNEYAVNDVEVVDDFETQKLNILFNLDMDSEDIDVIYSDSTPDEQITPNELQNGKVITVPASGNVKFNFKLPVKLYKPDVVNNTTGEYGADGRPDETVNNTATMTYNGTTSESTATIYGIGGGGRSATNNASKISNVGGTNGTNLLYNTMNKSKQM